MTTAAANRWSFAIVALERNGRVTLPAAARHALDECASLRAVARGEIVLVGPGAAGRPVTIDGRGRLVVPCWLRGAAEPAGSLLVGTRAMRDVEPIALLAPPRLLAGFADALVGGAVMDRSLRAQVLMAEAVQLGVSIDDLLVAARTLGARHAPTTVAEYLEAIAPTFSPGTAATYGTYWRLAVAPVR